MPETNQALREEERLSDVIRERRSVRMYDPEVQIPREILTELLQLAARAPSAANLQPWRFLVLDTPELKQKLYPIAHSQRQVIEASAVIAVLGDLDSVRMAERIYGQTETAGYMSADRARSFVDRYTALYASMTPQAIRDIAVGDCGLAAMQLMLAARARGYDTVPMGGFDKDAFAEAFGLSDRYVSVMLIAIGKAKEPGHPTVRLPIEEVAFFGDLP